MSDLYQRVRDEMDYNSAKKDSAKLIGQSGDSYTPDVYGKVRSEMDAMGAERDANLEKWKYTVPVTDQEYKVLNQALVNSPNPEEDSYKYAGAMTFAKQYNVPLEWAYQNLDTMSEYETGKKFTPNRSWLTSVIDSFESGAIDVEVAKLSQQYKIDHLAGKDTTALDKQISQLEARQESIDDKQPRWITTKALKLGAKLLPYTASVALPAAAAGTAAMGAAAIAGIGSAATVGSGGLLSPVAVGMSVAAIGAAAGKAVSFAEGLKLMEGVEYRRMVKNGIRPDIAAPLSSISGMIQSAAETFLGTIPGALGKVAGLNVNTLASDLMGKLVISGKLGVVGKALTSYAWEAGEEGIEEMLQEVTSFLADEAAASVQGVASPEESRKIFTRALEAAKGGFLGGLVLGGVGAAMDLKDSAKEVSDLRKMAGALEESDFVYMAKRGIDSGKITVFGDASDESLRTFHKANASRVQARTEEEVKDMKSVMETADITETEEDETPAGPAKRLANGKLFTAPSSKKVQNSDGSTKGYFLVGDPSTAKRYGYVETTTDTDGRIRIDAVRMKEGYKDLRKELITDFIASNQGQDIVWDPTDKAMIQLRDDLIAENPRGPDKGLSWFSEDDNPQEGLRLKALEKKLELKMPRINAEQRVGALHIVRSSANYLGITPDEFIKRAYAPEVFGDDPQVQAAQGKKGGVSWKQIEGMSKAIIYTTENSDFSTWAHENTHIMRRLLKDEDMRAVQEAYGITDWTTEAEERFATDAEKYLLNGEAPSEGLRALFQKIAKWMHEIYKGMTGKIDIDPRIKAVMDKLYSDASSPLSSIEAEPSTSAEEGQGSKQTEETGNDTPDVYDDATEAGSVEWYNPASGNMEKNDIIFQPAPPPDSQAFREWFGESKVVDAEGKPLVVYHGTLSPDIEEFKNELIKSRFDYSFGFHFTDRQTEAEVYASENADPQNPGRKGRVIPVYLKVENPLVITTNEMAASMEADMNRYEIITKIVESRKTDHPYDGVIIKTNKGNEWDGQNVIVFSPTQIKSVNNTGTWSKDDPRILYQPSENAMKAFESAKQIHGTTSDIYEAGYVLPDGVMLDFSGRFQASGYTKKNGKYVAVNGDYLKGDRAVDHREIEWDERDIDAEAFDNYMDAFISLGAIRIDANSGLADMAHPPTPKQWQVIQKIIDESGTAWVEMVDGKRRATIEADGNPKKAMGYTRRFYGGEDFKDTILFQTDSDLLDDARSFPSWNEFMEYYESFGAPEDSNVPDLAPEELATWYKETWERARKTQDNDPSDALTTDADFLDMIKAPGGVEAFMDAAVATMGFDTSRGALDEDEQRVFEEAEALKSRLNREAHATILNNIPRVAQGKPLTDRARKAIATHIKNGVRDYRALYADMTGDKRYRAEVTEGSKLPTMEDPRMEGWENLSIDQRNEIGYQIKDEATRKALLSGTDTIEDGEVERFIRRMDEKERDLNRKIAEMQEELKEDGSIINAANREARIALQKSKDAQRAFDKSDREVKRLMNKGEAVSEALSSARREAAMNVKEARKQEAELRRDALKEKAMGKQIALDDLRKQLREAQSQKDLARKERERKVKLAKRIMEKASDSVEYEYRQKIAAVQNLIDANFRKSSVWWGNINIQLEDVQKILAENTEYDLDALLTKKIVDLITKKSLDQWTVAELEELDEKVQAMRKEGKAVRDAYKEFQNSQARIMRNAIRDQLQASGKYMPPPPSGSESARKRLQTKKYKAMNTFLTTLNMDRIAEMADNGKPGMNTELLVSRHRVMISAEMREMDRRKTKVMKAFEKAGVTLEDFYKTVTIENSGPSGAAEWTYAQLLGVYLADRNDQSKDATKDGNLMSAQERATLDRDTLLAIAAERYDAVMKEVEKLPEGIRKAGDAIGEDFDTNFDRIMNTTIREFNKGVKKVVGYFPMFRQEATFDDLADTVGNELLNRQGVQMTRNAEKGFTESRIDIAPEHQKPIRLDAIDVWLTALEAQEHFVASAEYVRELNRVYKGRGSEATRSMIESTYGKGMLDKIDTHILQIANPQSFKTKDDTSALLRSIRGKLGIAYLGGRVSNVLMQLVTSPAPYLAYVSPVEMTAASFRVATNPLKAWKEIIEKSPIMKNRSSSEIMENLREARKKMEDGSLKAGFGKITNATMIGLEWADRASTMSGWLAVYERTLKETGDEAQAIAKADDVTLKTQPSGYWWNNSALFNNPKGGEYAKMITQFQSGLNVIWQNLAYDLPNAIKHREVGRAVGIVSSYIIAGAMVGLLKDGYDDDDDDAVSRTRKLLYWGMSQGFSSFPLIGGIVDGAAKQIITGEKQPIMGSDLFPVVSSGAATVQAVTDGKWEKAVKEFIEALGYSTGLPVSAIKEWGSAAGIEALGGDGEVDPGRIIGRRK